MKIVVKMLVDVTMTVIFLFLMFGYNMSPLYHEILGIAIAALFLIHILLNWKATKGIVGSLSKGRLKGATKANAIFDVLLMVMMPLDIISGLLDSKFLIYSSYNQVISTVHHAFSWTVLAIIAGHLYLHLNYLKATIKSKFLKGSKSKGNSLAFLGLLMIVGGLFLNSFLFVLNINNSSNSTVSTDTTSDENTDSSSSATQDNQTSDSSSSDDTTDSSTSTTTDDGTSSSSQSDQSTTDGSQSTTTTITLTEYLKGFNCDGCGRHCSLASPKCGIGVNQAEQATLEYESLYGQSDTSGTSLVVATTNN